MDAPTAAHPSELIAVTSLAATCVVAFILGVWRGMDRGPSQIDQLVARALNEEPDRPVPHPLRDALAGCLIFLGAGALLHALLPVPPGTLTAPALAYVLGMVTPGGCLVLVLLIVFLRASLRGAPPPRRESE